MFVSSWWTVSNVLSDWDHIPGPGHALLHDPVSAGHSRVSLSTGHGGVFTVVIIIHSASNIIADHLSQYWISTDISDISGDTQPGDDSCEGGDVAELCWSSVRSQLSSVIMSGDHLLIIITLSAGLSPHHSLPHLPGSPRPGHQLRADVVRVWRGHADSAGSHHPGCGSHC